MLTAIQDRDLSQGLKELGEMGALDLAIGRDCSFIFRHWGGFRIECLAPYLTNKAIQTQSNRQLDERYMEFFHKVKNRPWKQFSESFPRMLSLTKPENRDWKIPLKFPRESVGQDSHISSVFHSGQELCFVYSHLKIAFTDWKTCRASSTKASYAGRDNLPTRLASKSSRLKFPTPFVRSFLSLLVRTVLRRG